MKKAIFIDRDGTLIIEPRDEQIDSLEKLEFCPGVFRNLYLIHKNLDFELVLVSNQDGLGTPSFPNEDFLPPHQKFITAFRNEGIEFDDVLIDGSLPSENSPNRKPGTGMLAKYMKGDYDLENSFVIGDRLTDLELARNLNARGILYRRPDLESSLKEKGLGEFCALCASDWDEIALFLLRNDRKASVTRKTSETRVSVELEIDGSGQTKISTGLGFFDHMLSQIGRHSGCNLSIDVKGDLHVDEHHTIEDTALALGEAFSIALSKKKGIRRYGFLLPMDDSLAQAAIDFGGRSWLTWVVEFKREKVGDVPTEMFFHFFKSFTDTAKCNLNIKAEGDNDHHKIEAVFKAFAMAIRMAVHKDFSSNEIPSTKGTL